MQNMKIVRLFILLCLCFPGRLSACWDATKPIDVPAGNAGMRITFEGGPTKFAVVMLRNRQSGESIQSSIDRDGWVKFLKVRRGTYKLVIDGPSHESFDVVAAAPASVQSGSTLVYVFFSKDYCAQIRVLEDPTVPTY